MIKENITNIPNIDYMSLKNSSQKIQTINSENERYNLLLQELFQ